VVVGTAKGAVLPHFETVNTKVAAPEIVEMTRKHGGEEKN